MGVLTKYLDAEAEHLKAEEGQREQAVQEWVTALEALYAQIREWLIDADKNKGLLSVIPSEVSEQEGRLGGYTAPAIRIKIAGRGRHPMIVPRARYVVAAIRPPGKEQRRADGMVELRDGTTAEYYLFRWKTAAGDEWYIRNVTLWNADREYGTVEPLDRDRFEAAVLSILR